jgi:EAL domain-containing protein (putative c-di-GMP-specific phosphodiesterase class I)
VLLAKLGVDYIQGYHLNIPMTQEDILKNLSIIQKKIGAIKNG